MGLFRKAKGVPETPEQIVDRVTVEWEKKHPPRPLAPGEFTVLDPDFVRAVMKETKKAQDRGLLLPSEDSN